MNHCRLLLIGTLLMVALTAAAQQSANVPGGGTDKEPQAQHAAPTALPTVEQHLNLLSEKLDLTPEQRDKVRPILQQMQESWQNIMRDESLSEQAREAKMKAVREKAEKQARPMLTDEQKKKLDELEQEPHS